MGNPAQSIGMPWMMWHWLEPKEEDLAEDVSGIMGSQDTLVIAHSNGVFHHHIQWCACPGSAPHHNQLFRHGLFFKPVFICPRPLSLLMCLTIFTWMPWNARLLVGAFSKS